jgi:AraC family transcriptional regulator
MAGRDRVLAKAFAEPYNIHRRRVNDVLRFDSSAGQSGNQAHRSSLNAMPDSPYNLRHIGSLHSERACGGFTLGYWFVGGIQEEIQPHGHREAHLMYALTTGYSSVARGERGPHPGFLVFNPPQTWHSDRLEMPGSFFSFGIDQSLWESLREYRFPEQPFHISGLRPRMSIRRIVQELARWDATSPALCEAFCYDILSDVAEGEIRERRRPPWLDRACSLLRERRDFALKDIARETQVHPHHLAKVFRRDQGCTTGEYLLAIRLESAQRLIAENQLSLAEIAIAAGFADQSHFTKRFRTAFGITPGEYRRNICVRRPYAYFGQDKRIPLA